MQQLLDRPGPIPPLHGGNVLRLLYQRSSRNIDVDLLSDFARDCYTGNLSAVKQAIESGDAPDILGTETPYKYGYAVFTVFGAQRFTGPTAGTPDHAGTLKYLLEQGAPPNLPDLVGYTALHHVCNVHPRPDLVRILLDGGANPDQQDRFGSVPILGAMQNGSVRIVDSLMEYGASLDVEDAEQCTPEEFSLKAGPHITATVQRWKRKRAGQMKPLDEKKCAGCGETEVELKYCANCGTVWYCSKECQKSNWPVHKLTCVGLDGESTVTLTPFYEDIGRVMPTADLARASFGYPVSKQSKRNMRSVHVPVITPGATKKMIIKVQVPFSMDTGTPHPLEIGDLMVFDRKRTLVCRIRRQDNPDAYLRLSRMVRKNGVNGAKAYFWAEMDSPERLQVKVSEVLAEQAF
ncbi:ankyrin [Trametes meyenii]|nr:ankyrin [Trametes meyenii]